MSNGIALGVSGIEAELGDHICGLYRGDLQRDQVLIPFLEAGLTAGDKCLCVVDGTDPTKIVRTLEARLDASAVVDTKQLEVIRASDMYLRSGGFSADEVIGAWKAAMSDVMYDGRFDAVRAVETWSRRDVVPDTQELLVLESEMNRYLPLFPQVVVCLYDIDRFGGGIIIDLLKTHPRVLVGEVLLENPYYLAPDELLAEAAQGDGGVTANSEIEKAAQWYFDETTGST
ncbi:MAG: hypothetical protein QOF99_5984 [Pseudonocardiales bacterium]|nr:hypothetical protein [Pseudonocardiales bacterium]